MSTAEISMDQSGRLADTDKPIVPIRYEDEFRKFREKRKMSKKKIKGFFGESVHVDVPISLIMKKGLSVLLQSNVPLCYFLYALLVDMNAENLFFYLEVEQFEEHHFATVKTMRKTAMELYNAFIKPGSDFEINLEARVRDAILPRIEGGDQGCFSEAREQVVHLLIPCYSNFTRGPVYTRMVGDVGEKTTLYSKEERDKAVNVILEFVDKDLNQVVIEDKGARRREVLLREMVHSFCRTRLRCDFKDKVKDQVKKETEAAKRAKPSNDTMAYAT